MKLLLVLVVAGLLAVATADSKEFGSSELYVVTDGSQPQAVPSSYSSSSVGFSERSDNQQQQNSFDTLSSLPASSSYSSLFETSGTPFGFGTPKPHSNFRRNDGQPDPFSGGFQSQGGFAAPGLLQSGVSPAGSISNFLGGYTSGAQGLGLDFGRQQGGLGGHFGAQQQAFNPYQQQFQTQFGGLGGQGFQQPLGSAAGAFSSYALPGQGFTHGQVGGLGQQNLIPGAQYLTGGQNFQAGGQLPFGVQQALRQAQSMHQPFFAPRGNQGFGGGFAPLQPHFGAGAFGGSFGGGNFGAGGRGSSNSGRGSSRGSSGSVTSRLFAPLTQLASSLYGSSSDDTSRAGSTQRSRGFLGRGTHG